MGAEKFLTLPELGAIESLELRANVLVEGFLAGMHRSPKFGTCPEFREYRDYRPGDELRQIDWRASTRGERLLLRLREDETDLKCHIVVDTSRSMDFRGGQGCMSKWQYAQLLAAALILLLRRQGDAPGLALVGAGLEDYHRPSGRRSAALRMLAALDRAAVGNGSAIVDYLEELSGRPHPNSLVAVISDFYADPYRLRDILGGLAAAGCETLLLHILDPAETELEWQQAILLEALEGEGKLLVHPDLQRRDYARILEGHLEKVRHAAAQANSAWSLCRTDAPPLRALAMALAMRDRRRGGR